MSTQAIAEPSATTTTSSGDAAPAIDFNDPEFVASLLSSGDPNDPIVQAALAQLRSASNADKDSESKDRKRKQDET